MDARKRNSCYSVKLEVKTPVEIEKVKVGKWRRVKKACNF